MGIKNYFTAIQQAKSRKVEVSLVFVLLKQLITQHLLFQICKLVFNLKFWKTEKFLFVFSLLVMISLQEIIEK